MLGNGIKRSSSEPSIFVLGYQTAQIRHAPLGIDAGNDCNIGFFRVHRAVLGKQAESCNLLVFHVQKNGHAPVLDIVAVAARARKRVVLTPETTGTAARMVLPIAIKAADSAM